jgi:hypothetical protein
MGGMKWTFETERTVHINHFLLGLGKTEETLSFQEEPNVQVATVYRTPQTPWQSGLQ